MAVNLIRNSRVFFTTNVDGTTGVVQATGCDTADTFEIQVLDGFSFTQNTTSETVTLNEAGDTPIRGQRSFNTALEPVEFSFSTYIRPRDGGSTVAAEEYVLWDAFAAKQGSVAWTAGTPSTVDFADSNAHQLKKFGMIMVIDNDTYVIDNCVLDQASIDFGIDAIATIAWTGRGSAIRRVSAVTLADSGGTTTLTGGVAGEAVTKITTAAYLANKLSAVAIRAGINNGSGTLYTVPITGGNITISNNVTYLTPANLGVVNKPITYFTGSRTVSGNLTAYLKTGSGGTSALLEALLTGADTTTEPKYNMVIHLGGSATATVRVELNMMGVVLQIPTINSEQVISTTINFTAQGYTSGAYDVEETNELVVKYYHPI